MISFEQPYCLLLLLLLPLFAYLRGKIGKEATIRFSNVGLVRRLSKRSQSGPGRVGFFLRLLAFGLLFVAMAGPRTGKSLLERNASGIDIVLAVDVSSSMLALDFTENKNHLVTRLDLAKNILHNFIAKRPNDRIGLVAFAGNPYLVAPLTLNHDYLFQNLERLKIGLIEDGTAIGSAIATGTNRLRKLTSKSRILILLTDGVNNMGVDPVLASEAAASFDVKIYTIAMGNDGPIPSLYLDDKGKPATNIWGQPDIVYQNNVLDTKILQQISEKTHGLAYRANNRQQLEAIYEKIDQLEKTDVKLLEYVQHSAAFHWPAWLAFALLLLEAAIGLVYRRIP
ncbi:MAG: hypothetical protein A2Y14_00470 [Verrucomicrobia bacterium GWF2_51_19]|nr:MAG: hypothetical protein A2Y14_00470 [Verrucomicrobia bacterium GWF2_51_19]HCJ12190.1 hypothetical protein [Opitutae bacterium]